MAAVAGLALAASLVGGLGSPAGATEGEDTAEFLGNSELVWDVWGHYGDDPETASANYNTGLKKLRIEGESEPTLAYCVEPFAGLDHGGYPLHEQEWDESGVANHDIIARILAAYFPIGSGPEGYELVAPSDREKAAATQAAIWHFMSGFNLLENDTTGVLKPDTGAIYADYLTILRAVEDDVLATPTGRVTLSIDGPSLEDVLAGQSVGPFVVHTTAASVELSPEAGLSVENEDGTPFEGPAHDGDEFWLKSDEGGTLSLTAMAAGLEGGVRYFKSKDFQDFAFATVTPKEVQTAVEVTFGTPPPSTAPETTTTTTVPETTTTTVPETTTTVPATSTVPVVPQSSTRTGGGLPVTGAQTVMLVIVALVLLGAGAAFAAVSRRSRGTT